MVANTCKPFRSIVIVLDKGQPLLAQCMPCVLSTDKATEEAILEAITKAFPDHLVLGEEGGVSGGPNSDYLWCIDPLGDSLFFTLSDSLSLECNRQRTGMFNAGVTARKT